MALGTITSLNHGIFNISGAGLIAKLDGLVLSGAAVAPPSIHLVPTGDGEVCVIQIDTATG